MPFFGSLGILITRALVVAAVVVAIIPVISTLAGNGESGLFNGTFDGSEVQFNTPYGIAVDSDMNVYVADYSNNRIRKIAPTRVVTTLAGSGTATFADGTGTNASFNQPTGIAVDSSNNVYVVDRTNNRVRKITPVGVVTTLAGQTTAGSADGTGTNASFTGLIGIAVNSSGDIFVCEDSGSNRIRRITPEGVVTTFVSSGLRSPSGMVFNSAGELYVTNATNHYISKVSPGGVVTDIAGAGSATVNGGGAAVNGTGTNAVFFTPLGAGIDSAGNVYIADGNNNRIRKMTPAGVVTTLAGSGTATFADGTGTNASFSYPFGIAVDSAGNVYVGDGNNHRIRKISPAGLVTTLAGSGVAQFTNSVRPYLFSGARGVGVDSIGNVYVADSGNRRIRKITPEGVVTTIIGNGLNSTGLGGVGTNSSIDQPQRITVDRTSGDLFVSTYSWVFRVTSAGVLTVLAGSINNSPLTDGFGTNVTFNGVSDLALYGGNLYVADIFNHRIRSINIGGGGVGTYAGSGPTGSGNGNFADGGLTNSRFNAPAGISVDSLGNFYVADTNNQRIRKISGGVVSTLAGTGALGSINGAGASATFRGPQSTIVDSSNRVYVADGGNNSIRRITSTGVVSTFATGFNVPYGLAIDSADNIYVADQGNNRISRITPAGVVTILAGSTNSYSDGGWFNTPVGITVNTGGILFVADQNNHTIRRITPEGVVTTYAGLAAPAAGGAYSGLTNGTGTNARFNLPAGIAFNSDGLLYVADSGNRRIRSINTGAVAAFFAGSGTSGSVNGTGASASFNTPFGITVDRAGIIYVSDIGNHNIRRITSGGVVTTLAGSVTSGSADGIGTNARFNTPRGLVSDIYGNLYVADTNNHCIRRVTSDGTVTTFAGSTAGYADGTGTNAQFNFPYHLSIDPLGTLYVADQTNHRIRTIQTSTGVVSTLIGGTAGFTPSRLNGPQGIIVDQLRQAYVADTDNHTIRRINDVYSLQVNNQVVTTLAGNGTTTFANGNGTSATFNFPTALAVDSAGNVFVADRNNERIRRITPAGVVTTFAGSGTAGSTDSTGTNATFNLPTAIVVDSAGNLFVSDRNTYRIRQITPAAVVTTFAGTTFGYLDGQGTSARFSESYGIAIDSARNIYVADTNNHRIRRISSTGLVTTLAGSGTAGSGNGTGASASFNLPYGVAVDLIGNVYVSDYGNQLIRKITPAGVVTTLAGNGTTGSTDGIGTNATFANPYGLTVDIDGNIYVADLVSFAIRRITPAGVVTTFAGSGVTGAFADGVGTNARFNQPNGVTIDSYGNLYVADTINHRIRKIGNQPVRVPLNQGIVTTFVGNATYGTVNGTGTNAQFTDIRAVAIGLNNNIYTSEATIIRMITTAGVVTTLAGQATAGSANGTGTNAQFSGAHGLAVDSMDNVYVSEENNERIRRITPAGVVTTFAGSGTAGSTDSTGTNASFNRPNGIAMDSAGNIYVADSWNHRIRKITPAGVVTTFAGGPSDGNLYNGTGTNASFWYPRGVAVDLAGNVYVADTGFNRIRKITPAGVVTILAGAFSAGYLDGLGTNAQFTTPWAITVDSVGNVYVVDAGDNRIRRITPEGVVTTLAGSGIGQFADGIGTNASFYSPRGIVIDSLGIMYVADIFNYRVRRIT